MAIGHPGAFYDINRDTYFDTSAYQAQYERELYRQKEEDYRRQRALMQNAVQQPDRLGQAMLMSKAPKPDPKDPLAFLHNTDKKVLLTGEMQ